MNLQKSRHYVGVALIFLNFFLINCSEKGSGTSVNFLSLIGLFNEAKPNTSSTPPPYGNQPPGATPTNNGVPVSHSAALNLYETHELNPNILELFGIFYHNDPNFPELRQITDVSIVKFNDNLAQSGQEDWDFNQLILDSKMGNIIYSRGLKGMAYFSDTDLKNAKQIVALPNGVISILSGIDSILPCWKFNGNQIVKISTCNAVLNLSPKKIIAYGQNAILALDSTNRIHQVNLTDNTHEILNFRYQLNNIINISANENVVLVIYDNGYSVTAFLDTGSITESRFEEKASNHNLRISFNGDEASLTEKFRISEIVRNFEGRFFAYSPDFHKIISLDPFLKPTNGFWSFLPKLIPFMRIKNVNGLRMYPNSRLLYVFSSYSLDCFSEIDYESRADLLRYIPDPLQKVFEKVDSLKIEDLDPKQNIFKIPSIEQVIIAEKAKLL
ncbi:LIC_11904 family protein [Leptospira terpstrae]|uniref:Uncharacterized protein n=1 Tax=Leptospira terpstrae serovar Hualin str. LT 11-33 = ATCC 700639 TaxID=1257025 RepID=N1VUH6_9LEPT|nr:hypothetical protein [Leptospira terpstrae]EMY60657.1 hypothetical protein LEP1GSC203_0344 [Leptospira terpstrae serovar Hualin str. LT 11-33 = ATCC 700639]